MLASKPPRNSRSELIADDGEGMIFPACPRPWHRPDRKADRAQGVKDGMHRTDRFRMPQKTHSEGALMFHKFTCRGASLDRGRTSELSNLLGEQ